MNNAQPIHVSQAVAQMVNSIPNHAARAVLLSDNEPPHGSVVMVHGESGTAYQRHYSDGLWHGTNGKTSAWNPLIDSAQGNVLIILWVPKSTN